MVTITGDEIIQETVQKYPKVAPILTRYGLHCVGCHVSAHETLRDGVMVHGMPDETFDEMIAEVNLMLNKKIETLDLTDNAIDMIKHYAAQDGKEGEGLKITVTGDEAGMNYDMEFVSLPGDDDKIFDFKGVQIFLDQESYGKLKGSEIDFVTTPSEAGFRINNPNVKKNKAIDE